MPTPAPNPKPDEQVVLTEREIELLIETTVSKTLTSIGLDHTNPIELQKDFQRLRDWRNAMDDVRSKSILTLVGLLVTGLVAAVWLGVRALLN